MGVSTEVGGLPDIFFSLMTVYFFLEVVRFGLRPFAFDLAYFSKSTILGGILGNFKCGGHSRSLTKSDVISVKKVISTRVR